MAEKLYQMWNGPAPTSASQAAVSTGTSIKTMLQLSTPSTAGIYIVEWGFWLDELSAPPLAAGVEVELLDTSVAATSGTATLAADVMKYSEPTGRVTLLTTTFGTGGTGFSFGTEGTPATVRMIDATLSQPGNYYYKQYPAGREPTVDVSRFVRIRAKTASAVNMICYICWGE